MSESKCEDIRAFFFFLPFKSGSDKAFDSYAAAKAASDDNHLVPGETLG